MKQFRTSEIIQVQWTKHFDNLKKHHLEAANELLEHFVEKFNKRLPIRSIEIHIDQSKNSAGKLKNQFMTKLHILLQSGNLLLATSKDRTLMKSIRDAIHKITHEVEVSDRQKHEFHFKTI